DVNGKLSISMDEKLIEMDATNQIILLTSLATVDEGYAILYAKYSSDNSDMSPLGGLYVIFIGASIGNPIPLFQITKAEMKINAVHCNACFGFCYYCVASINYNNTVYYEEIIFSSVATMGSGQLNNTPKEPSASWNVVSSTPVGGYIFSSV
ncbi:397_t:CDS:1, partial [Racocetra fulgida]